jgi:hypothetical protein
VSISSTAPPEADGHGDTAASAPEPPATSEVTRLLSIGAHLDRQFADRVIEELLENRQRLAAPAYGYDAATVLGHALAARRLRRTKVAVFVGAGAQWFVIGVLCGVMGSLGATAFWVATVLGLWGAWAMLLAEKVVIRQIITVHLRPPTRPGARYGFDGEPPASQEDMTDIYDEIRQEQDGSSGLVYYSGYVPFVGAGHQLRAWSFAVLLDAARAGSLSALRPPTGPSRAPDADAPPTPAEPKPFTGEELTAYVEERLTAHLLTEVAVSSQRLHGLEVTRRLYAQANGPVQPDLATSAGIRAEAAAQEPSDHYNAAREFLAVRVGSWSQELVLTVFLNVDLKGRVLYTQLHAYQLMPIKAAYHEADRLPRGVNGRVLGTLARKALAETLFGMVGAVVAAPLSLLSLLSRKRGAVGGVPSLADLDEQDQQYTDWGALTSIRELGSSAGYSHYFQQMDSAKYFKVIERRTLEVILDFLDHKDVDTTEFRARQAEVLNVGILQTGSGTIVNKGATAVGSDASASARHERN